MAYGSFLISNYKTGLQTARDPWLSPEDAFVTLENSRVAAGVIEKRTGHSPLAQMVHGNVKQTSTVLGLWSHQYNYTTWIIACDNKRPNIYDPSTGTMIDISGGLDVFGGSVNDEDMFNFLQKDNRTYMTNGQTGVYYFDDSTFEPSDISTHTVTELDMSLSTTSLAKINSCKQMFALSDRLIMWDIVEDGTSLQHRLRFSQGLTRNSVPIFTDDNFLDIPTDDRPVTGRVLGRNLYLWFEHSLWVVKPSGDTVTTFRSERLRDDLGSVSSFVCIPFKKGLMTLGHKHLIHFDGFEVRELDLPNLQNILDDFNLTSLKYSWGIYDETNDRVYITMTDSGSTLPDRILEYNVIENTYCKHRVNAQTLVMFNGSERTPWDDADAAFGSDGDTLAQMPIAGSTTALNSEAWYPVFGTRDGFIHRLFNGTSDNMNKYIMRADSARFNPFSKNGLRCAMGRVAFLVDTDSAASFVVNLHKNTSETAYKSQVLKCTGNESKTWVSLHAGGEIGDFHQIRIYNTGINNKPRIHATWLEMEQAGYIDP